MVLRKGRRRGSRGKKAAVGMLALVGVALLGGCTSAQGNVAVTACGGSGGTWQMSGTLTNTDSTSHSYQVAGELLTSDGTEISSGQVSVPSVAGGATAPWQLSGEADPNVEAEGGLQCGAKLSIPSSEVALVLFFGVLLIAWVVLVYVAFWRLFKKLGRPAWHGIVPFYNIYVLAKMSDVRLAWFFLMFVPWVNIVAFLMLGLGVARSFGKSSEFGVGLGLLPPVFFPMLAFGPAVYQGPGGRPGAPTEVWPGTPATYPPAPAYPPPAAYPQAPAYPSRPAAYPPAPGGWAPGGWAPSPTGSKKSGGLAPPGSLSYRPGTSNRG